MTDTTQGQDAASPSAAGLPDADTVFPDKLPDADKVFPDKPARTDQPVRNVSPIQDALFSNPSRSHARILDAFGYGFKQDWGAAEQEHQEQAREADQWLRKSGMWNDYANGQRNIIKAANEVLMRPFVSAIVAAVPLAKGVGGGTLHGAQEALVQAGQEYGFPNLARELAAMPEAFPAGVHQMVGVPHLPAHVAEAKSLDVIGAGEDGYFGTKPTAAEAPHGVPIEMKIRTSSGDEAISVMEVPEAKAEEAPSPIAQPAAAPEAAPAQPAAPDIHAVARQIAPDTFRDYDALALRKETFRRWIDELRETRDQTAAESAPHTDAIAALDEQIKTIQDEKKGGFGKLQALTKKRDAMVEERDAYIADKTQGDSADMVKIRQQLMETDYRMRDLAPDVATAYRAAEGRMGHGEAEAPQNAVESEAPQAVGQGAAAPAQRVENGEPQAVPASALAERAAEAPTGVNPTGAHNLHPKLQPTLLPIANAPSIVADVAQKLTAAGRPAEEANAAAQVVAAYWETRAQRFEGRKGTAAEMYAAEAPEIKAGNGREKQASRELEMAQTATRQGRIRLRDDGRATITLLKNADASTFIHETGHDWLDRMLDDARDAAAPETLRNDAATVLKWLGVDHPDAVKTRHHEKFARGFETYMLEGRAPSSALARVFAQFKAWLTTIYKTAAALKAPISDDIRGVFDRLLAEKPEKTVIAAESETGQGLGDKHENAAEVTTGETAFPTAGMIRGERDVAARGLDEDADARLEDARKGVGEHPPGSAQPAGDANEAGPLGQGPEAAGRAGEVGASGSEAQSESARPRKAASERIKTKPTPLLNFIASRGGISANDAMIQDLRETLGGKNRYIPGYGQLIRAPKQLSSAAKAAGRYGAMPLDRAREALVEDGLLPRDASVTDMLRAIDDEVRGIGAVEREVDAGETAHHEHSVIEHVNDTIKDAGGAELTEDERARALELFRQEGLTDPAAIIERLALEADDHESANGAPDHPADIPGWHADDPGYTEIPDEYRDAPAAGGAIAGAQSAEPGSSAARTGSEAQEQAFKLDPTVDLPRPETQLIDKAGNIRLDNLGTPEDVSAVIRATAQELSPYDEAITRGRIPDADVLKLADALGMDAEKLNQRKIGEAFNAEQIVAARRLLIQSATDVRDLAAKIAGGTDADVLAYAQARARHLMIQEQVSGLTAEAGRALRAFRNLAGSKEAGDLSAFLRNTQGKTLYQMKEEGALLAMMGTPQQVSKAIAETTTWQKTRGGILSWFINNLISGPITHAGYSVGNTVVQLFKATIDTPVAAALSALRDAPPEERVYFGEVGAQLYGMVRGGRDAIGPSITALKTGVPFMKGDVDGLLGQIEAAHRPQAIPGKIGYVLETPSRAVTAIHTMHYSMNYEAEIARRAYRTATAEGLERGSTAFNTRIAELTQSPPQAMMEAAHDEALKMVLMKSSQFGTAQYHLQKAVNSNILAKIVMPFMQVGANILHESFIERTPIGLMSQTVRDNLTGKNGEAARSIQASRIAVGIGVSTAVIGLTAEGILTGGGPSDPKQMAIKEMTGWRPYSIKVGQAYVPYRKYLGGLGPLIAGTADMYEVGHALTEEGLTKAAAASLFGFAEVIADESWARGLANFIDAARHWDRDGERYLRNLAADFIPFSVGLSQITNLTDPYRREVRSLLDSARAHIPGMSRGLYPVRDIWGEPIESHTALGPSFANPDRATQALLDAKFYPARMQRKIRGIELTDQQYDDVTRMAGRMAKMRMNAIVSIPGFANLPIETRVQMIKDIFDGEKSARAFAQDTIIAQTMNDPNGIARKAIDAKRDKLPGAAEAKKKAGETVH